AERPELVRPRCGPHQSHDVVAPFAKQQRDPAADEPGPAREEQAHGFTLGLSEELVQATAAAISRVRCGYWASASARSFFSPSTMAAYWSSRPSRSYRRCGCSSSGSSMPGTSSATS